MSITDELREYANTRISPNKGMLTAIADRIDIAHKHAIGYVDDRDPDTMAENGWVRLPKDADGKYIRIGDVMQMLDDNELREVVGFYEEGFLAWLNGRYVPCKARFYYHAPTVEDMLWELLGKITPSMEDKEAVPIVKAYAEKLRLADDGKEQ